MNRATRRALDQAAATLTAAFEQAGPFPDQEVTPPLLVDALRQCLDLCQQVDATEDEMPPEEVDELAAHALECLSDLGLWAWQLQQDAAYTTFEDVALLVAQWTAGHGGQITVLGPAVNALARQANATTDPADLAALFDSACDLIAHAAPESAEAAEPPQAGPWQMLHLSCAIIAIRSQQPELIDAACDLLESHLPQLCAGFYEEAVRELQKKAYGAPVRTRLRERLAKWTPRR